MSDTPEEIREARLRLTRLYKAAIGNDVYPSHQWTEVATDDHHWITAFLGRLSRTHEVSGEPERENDWEKCGRCGIRYPEIYWADDDQWARVVGDPFAGLRCLACFCEAAQDAGLVPRFKILAPSLAAPVQPEGVGDDG